MSEMIEQIADAMWDRCRDLHQMPMFAHEHGWSDVWPDEYAWMRSMIRSQARAAIWAMREPTPAMLAAANFAYDESPMAAFADSDDAMAEAIRAMIDEALK